MSTGSSMQRRRESATGYGSQLLDRSHVVAVRCHDIQGTGLRALVTRLRLGWLVVILYRLLLPSLVARLSDSPAGRNIAEHLEIRDEAGGLRYRRAQGVLHLPEQFGDYTRGRHRQAVRTNLKRAREQGLEVVHETLEDWVPGVLDVRQGHLTPTTVERWFVTDAAGEVVADSILVVDEEFALLHGLVSHRSYARWLLHTAIVERLCGHCKVLLTNSPDVPLLDPGVRHFQRLLGYSIVKLCLPFRLRRFLADPGVRLGASCVAVAGVILGIDACPGVPAFGEGALVWLTALVAVRRASNRAGVAALTAGLAACLVAIVDSYHGPLVPLGYLLAGVVVDLLLALFPRLTWHTWSVAMVGVAAIGATVVAPAFPTLGRHRPNVPWPVPPVLAAVAFGAAAAVLGWWLGKLLMRVTARPPAVRGQT